jgi:hypothetical protein
MKLHYLRAPGLLDDSLQCTKSYIFSISSGGKLALEETNNDCDLIVVIIKSKMWNSLELDKMNSQNSPRHAL